MKVLRLTGSKEKERRKQKEIRVFPHTPFPNKERVKKKERESINYSVPTYPKY